MFKFLEQEEEGHVVKLYASSNDIKELEERLPVRSMTLESFKSNLSPGYYSFSSEKRVLPTRVVSVTNMLS